MLFVLLCFSVFFAGCSNGIKNTDNTSKDKNISKAQNQQKETEKEQKDLNQEQTIYAKPQTEQQNQPIETKPKSAPEINLDNSSTEIDMQAVLNEILNPVNGSKAHEMPSVNIDSFDKDLNPFWTGIDEIAEKAQYYYSENFSKTRLISKNGYLFNKAAEEYIDVRYLCDREELNKSYLGYDYKVLLLYGKDVAQYSELSIKDSDMDLAVFTAFKHPEKDSYLIASANSTGGIIDGWKFRSLLEQYSQNHGRVNQLLPQSVEYERILTFIKMFESKYDNYFVRSILTDNKYAFVTLSSQTSTADVKQYILQKQDGLWEVVMGKLENESRLAVAVNKKLPDFNIEMLPDYTIYDYKDEMKTEFHDIIAVLAIRELISNVDEISYMAGTSNYAYAITTMGERYLFLNQGGTWDIKTVENGYEAYNIMLSIEKDAPVFLILDE